MPSIPKAEIIRDREYLDWLRGQRCVVSLDLPPDGCDPAHVRMGAGGGMGLKPGDNNALPIRHDLHAEQHRIGEIEFWRKAFNGNPRLMMACVRAYAHEMYREYLDKK